jgi:RND family efflux transporter MFP subunit
MKKVLYAVIPMLLVAGIIVILMNNKAKSDAKAKVPPPKALSVAVAKVSRQSVSQNLALVGTIVANREVLVASETQGRIKAVGVKVGDRISSGSVIVRVDEELKQAALANAQVNYDKAKADLERYKTLQTESQGGVSDIQVQNMYQTMKGAEASLIVARRQLRDTRITAPISGVVTARPVEIGSSLAPGSPVATIVDISVLKVKVNVPEGDVFKLHNGDRVEITTDVYPGVSFNGSVTMIGAKADEAHTYPVEITVANNAANPLRAGMFGRVQFSSIPHKQALMIPREAVVGSVKQPRVYVVNNGVAKLRDIVVGGEEGTSLEVVSGLLEGDQVVVSGQNNLRDNVQVTVVSTK